MDCLFLFKIVKLFSVQEKITSVNTYEEISGLSHVKIMFPRHSIRPFEPAFRDYPYKLKKRTKQKLDQLVVRCGHALEVMIHLLENLMQL